ncbi:potassium transporter [Psychrobacillus sp. AK 1817]|uniref:potassium transporter n=1 Tax=Psychrobacillus sp. AK 1817 TaxID=2303505 RepID=UPI0012443F13|nr:potassium transporter [Psychrobacillus sp. AK 1817]QEY19254.1 potassium transporter [Psychrobacillus sp. AK 1817]
MNELVSNKQTGYLLLVALIAVLLGALYFFLINPLKEEKESKEVIISNVRNEIDLLSTQLNTSVVEEENTFLLEKKVPLTRELDRLVQSIEKVELISEARIASIDFNNYDEIVADSSLATTETEVPSNEPVITEEELLDGELAPDTPVSPVANTTLPPQLKLITFKITVLAKDYDHLSTFIKEIESLERIYRIDEIEFSLAGEEELYDRDTQEAVSATIQVTTFYYGDE